MLLTLTSIDCHACYFIFINAPLQFRLPAADVATHLGHKDAGLVLPER